MNSNKYDKYHPLLAQKKNSHITSQSYQQSKLKTQQQTAPTLLYISHLAALQPYIFRAKKTTSFSYKVETCYEKHKIPLRPNEYNGHASQETMLNLKTRTHVLQILCMLNDVSICFIYSPSNFLPYSTFSSLCFIISFSI